MYSIQTRAEKEKKLMPMDYVRMFMVSVSLMLIADVVHGAVQTEVKSIEDGVGRVLYGINLINKITNSIVLFFLMVIMLAIALDMVGFGGKWILYLFESGGALMWLESKIGLYYGLLISIPLWNIPAGLFVLSVFFGHNYYTYRSIMPNYNHWFVWQQNATSTTRDIGFRQLGQRGFPVGMVVKPSLISRKRGSSKKSSEFKLDPNIFVALAQVLVYLFMFAIFIIFAICSWLFHGMVMNFVDVKFTPNGFEAA